jgi:hypothetical protein
MDNISEQLVKINKTPKDYCLLGIIWLVAFALVFFFVLMGRVTAFSTFGYLFAVGIIYGAFKLSKFFNVEYEYIVVNRDLDVDKITAQSSRKRMVSIKLNEVLDFGEFTPAKAQSLAKRHFDEKFICCNANDNAHYLTYKHPKKGMVLLVIAMNERTKAEALKSIPRTVIS